MGRRDSCSTPRRSKPMISTSFHQQQQEEDDDSIPLQFIQTFMGNSEKSPYTHRSSPVFTRTPSKQKSVKKGTVTPASLRSLRQCRCIHQPEAKDQRCSHEGKTKSSRCLRCGLLLPIFESRSTLEGLPDLVRVKNPNEKPKKTDDLLQSVQSISISEVNYDMASTPSSSLACENDISDVFSLKTEIDGFNENCRKNDCRLQSAQQSLICEGDDLISSTPSCKPSFQNEDIESLPDFVNTESSNENLRVKYCHDMLSLVSDSSKKLEGMADMIRVKSLNEKPKEKDGLLPSAQSISKSNDDMMSTPSSSLAYENDISDVVGLKSESDGFNENFRKNDCHLQSAQQSLICEGNDLILSTPSCKPSFQNEDIERLPDLVNTESSNNDIRENYCYLQYVEQISSSEGDAAHFPSLGNPTFDGHLENNQSMTGFASIDEFNQRLKVNVSLQSSQKVSVNGIWGTKQCVKPSLLQNKVQESESMLPKDDCDSLSVQLKYEEKQVIPKVSVKSQIDRYNENLSEKNFSLQSPKQTNIADGNDRVFSIISCISPFENRDIERLPASMTDASFKENLTEKECHLPSTLQLCSYEIDDEELSSCPGSSTFENDLDPNFASVDKLNEELKVRDFLQDLQKTSNAADQDRDNFGEINILQNKVEQSESFLLKEYHRGLYAHFHLEEKQNEIADMATCLETVEGSGLTADGKDWISELKHQVAVSSHWQGAGDSKGHQKYAIVANLYEGSPLKDVHDTHEERLAYFDNEREFLTDQERKLDQSSNEIEIMEIATKQYLAALIAAKEEPGEESLALAAGLRLELKSLLSIPSFSSFVSSMSRMHTLEN